MKKTLHSFAKINLHLQVLGRRNDGYHELRTLFQSVDLRDTVSVELDDSFDGVELVCSGIEVSTGESNLAVRAVRAFAERWSCEQGVRLRLDKRIPVGGGLGGGSSNAATVLLALRELLGTPERIADLWPAARELGADVPFFLVGGTALGIGRGDEVIPIPELTEQEVFLVVPPVRISTAEVFQNLPQLTPHPMPSSIMALLQDGLNPDLESLGARNDLQEFVFRRFPLVRDVYNSLTRGGARVVRLSGSGATLFALIDDEESETELANRLPPDTAVIRAKTLTRSSIESLRTVN